MTLGEPPKVLSLVSTSHGGLVFQDFMQNAIIPSHRTFQNGEIEVGVQFFINGVLEEGVFGNIPTMNLGWQQ